MLPTGRNTDATEDSNMAGRRTRLLCLDACFHFVAYGRGLEFLCYVSAFLVQLCCPFFVLYFEGFFILAASFYYFFENLLPPFNARKNRQKAWSNYGTWPAMQLQLGVKTMGVSRQRTIDFLLKR